MVESLPDSKCCDPILFLAYFMKKELNCSYVLCKKKTCDKFFDKHGLNFNHLHANNNNDDELKKFYRTFIVYRLCLDI